MSIIDGILQGAIQGITEFLPVSSDGHVTLYQHLTGLSGEGSLFFTLMLHLGTLVAVFIVYWREILDLIFEFFHMISDLFARRFTRSRMNDSRNMVLMLIVATLPLLGFVFLKGWVTGITEDSDIVVEGLCFLYTSVLLFLGAKCVKGRKGSGDMSAKDALIIGVFQGAAIMPGISRSGSTISSGLLLGYSKKYIVRFSFILGIPAILGASVFELKDALESGVVIEWAPVSYTHLPRLCGQFWPRQSQRDDDGQCGSWQDAPGACHRRESLGKRGGCAVCQCPKCLFPDRE